MEKYGFEYLDSISKKLFVSWAKMAYDNAEFIHIAELYSDICKENNMNQVMLFSQFILETGWLYRNGSRAGLDASFHNPCGFKITRGGGDFDRNAHKRFINWEQGIQAHIDHVCLYLGREGYPKSNTNDPRHFKYLFGTARNLESLCYKWCPSNPTYSANLRVIMNKIFSYYDRYKDVIVEEVEQPTPVANPTVEDGTPQPKRGTFKAIYVSDRKDILNNIMGTIRENFNYAEYDVMVLDRATYDSVSKLFDKEKMKDYTIIRIS